MQEAQSLSAVAWMIEGVIVDWFALESFNLSLPIFSLVTYGQLLLVL